MENIEKKLTFEDKVELLQFYSGSILTKLMNQDTSYDTLYLLHFAIILDDEEALIRLFETNDSATKYPNNFESAFEIVLILNNKMESSTLGREESITYFAKLHEYINYLDKYNSKTKNIYVKQKNKTLVNVK